MMKYEFGRVSFRRVLREALQDIFIEDRLIDAAFETLCDWLEEFLDEHEVYCYGEE